MRTLWPLLTKDIQHQNRKKKVKQGSKSMDNWPIPFSVCDAFN
jgi:hypothetical protein